MPPFLSGPQPEQNRLAVGFNQPPGSGDLYPFVAPSSDITQLLGDLFVSFDDVQDEVVYPLRVAWMAGFGTIVVPRPTDWPVPTHDYDLVIVDANDLVVFDSTTASFEATTWCDRLLIMEWTNGHNVCRCTKYLVWSPADVANSQTRTYESFILPVNGELQGDAWYKLPRRVTSLLVAGTTIEHTNVELVEGYNMGIAKATAAVAPTFQLPSLVSTSPLKIGARVNHRIGLNATPGLGLGVFPGCENAKAEQAIRTINHIAGNSYQNFNYDSEGCIRTQRPVGLTQPSPREFEYADFVLTQAESAAALKLSNDCVNCCDCTRFAQTYQGLKRQWFLFQDLAHAAEDVRDTYSKNRDRWLVQKQIREEDMLRVRLVSEGNCKYAWGISFCNSSKCCLSQVEVYLTWVQYYNGVPQAPTLAQYSCPPAYLEGSAQCDGSAAVVPYKLDAKGQSLKFAWDYSDPQSVTTVYGRHCLPDCKQVAAGSLKVKLHVYIRWAGVAPNPDTGLECEFPLLDPLDIPIEVRNVWTTNGVAIPADFYGQKLTSLSVASAANPFCQTCACD